MLTFPTTVIGIPCQCKILEASRAPAPEGNHLDFALFDRKGYPAPWLEKKLTPTEAARIAEECFIVLEDEEHDIYNEFG